MKSPERNKAKRRHRPASVAPPPSGLTRLNKFFLGHVDALPLRIFEIWMAVSFLLRLSRNFPVAEWLTEEGFHFTSDEWQRLGYPPAFPLLPLWGAYLFLTATVGATVLLIASIRWRRVALLGLCASALYVQGADYVTAFSANKQFIVVFFLLLTGPGILQEHGSGNLRVCAATVRAMQGTLLTIYLASGWAKCYPGDWLKYHDVLWTQAQGYHRTEAAAWALRNLPIWAWAGMQHTSLFFEVFSPLLIGLRRLRPLGFVLGIGMHLMIALFMKNLVYFSVHMCGYYVLFVSADQWRKALQLTMNPRLAVQRLPQFFRSIYAFGVGLCCIKPQFSPEKGPGLNSQSTSMTVTSSLCIKIISLAVVVWAVLNGFWLTAQNASWVPWLALLLLVLLDAYAAESTPASWSRWNVGLRQLLGPRVLPYYAALAVFLAFGPNQLRRAPQSGAPLLSVPSAAQGGERRLSAPSNNPSFGPPTLRSNGFPNNMPRPSSSSPTIPGKTTSSPKNNLPRPPIPAKSTTNQARLPAQPSPSTTPSPSPTVPALQPK